MLAIIRETLPSGLTQLAIGDGDFTQRVDYPTVLRSKTIKTPPKPSALQQQKPTHRCPTIYRQLMGHIDEMYEIYPEDMKRAAELHLKESMKSFLCDIYGRQVIGAQQSHDIMAFIARPHNTSPPDYFFELCSFLLNARVHVNGKVYLHKDVTPSKDIKISVNKK